VLGVVKEQLEVTGYLAFLPLIFNVPFRPVKYCSVPAGKIFR
jgi:hypothetical protein